MRESFHGRSQTPYTARYGSHIGAGLWAGASRLNGAPRLLVPTVVALASLFSTMSFTPLAPIVSPNRGFLMVGLAGQNLNQADATLLEADRGLRGRDLVTLPLHPACGNVTRGGGGNADSSGLGS